MGYRSYHVKQGLRYKTLLLRTPLFMCFTRCGFSMTLDEFTAVVHFAIVPQI